MGMVPHHRSAVEMARMALDKSTRPELKTLAQHIIDDQQVEIATMTRWLHDWYGLEPPTGTAMPMAGTQGMMPMAHDRMTDMDAAMKDLATKSGPDFDVGFMRAILYFQVVAMPAAKAANGRRHRQTGGLNS